MSACERRLCELDIQSVDSSAVPTVRRYGPQINRSVSLPTSANIRFNHTLNPLGDVEVIINLDAHSNLGAEVQSITDPISAINSSRVPAEITANVISE